MGDLKKYMIAVVVFAGVMIAMTGFYGSIIDNTQEANLANCPWCSELSEYESPISNQTRLNESIDNITQKIERMKNATQELKGIPVIGDFVAVLKSGIDAVIIGIDSFSISQNMIAEVEVSMGLPGWIGSVAIAVVLIVLVFSLIYVVTGRDA